MIIDKETIKLHLNKLILCNLFDELDKSLLGKMDASLFNKKNMHYQPEVRKLMQWFDKLQSNKIYEKYPQFEFPGGDVQESDKGYLFKQYYLTAYAIQNYKDCSIEEAVIQTLFNLDKIETDTKFIEKESIIKAINGEIDILNYYLFIKHLIGLGYKFNNKKIIFDINFKEGCLLIKREDEPFVSKINKGFRELNKELKSVDLSKADLPEIRRYRTYPKILNAKNE